MAYLWKYGGLYLDLDFLVLQPFEDREDNFVGAQHSSVRNQCRCNSTEVKLKLIEEIKIVTRVINS